MAELPAPAPAPTLPTRRELLDRIDRLAVSADAKALLAQLLATTPQIGGTIVQAGRRIFNSPSKH